MTLDASGRLGIGRTSMTYPLDVQAADGNGIRFTDSDNGVQNFFGAYLSTAIVGTLNNFPLTIWTNNAERMRITTGGNVGIGSSSPNIGTWNQALTLNTASGNAAYELAVGGSAQLYLAADNSNAYLQVANTTSPLRVYTGGSERMRITSSGQVGIGTSTPAAGVQLQVVGGIITCLDVYNNTTAAAANMQIDANGNFARSTSSLKYKTDVRPYDKGLATVMQLNPVYYKSKNINDGGKQFAGLIAEEIHNLGLTEFVQYAKDGSPDAISYQNMIALLTKAIQELKAEIETLKNK